MAIVMYPDIYFTPEYQDLFKDTEFGGIPCVFESSGIDYRFYKRPIEGTPYYDIVSPYGYSGPIEDPILSSHWGLYLEYFHEYCLRENIIAEFARLHPFIHRGPNPPGTRGNVSILYEHEIYYIDLTQSLDDIWKGFDKGCKSAIKKQAKDLFYLVLDPLPWLSAYRNSPNYQFHDLFFIKLFSLNGYNFIGAQSQQNQSVVGAVLLKYGDYCHYFLSAGHDGTNLILWESIKWAKYSGCKIFNLGGGNNISGPCWGLPATY